MLPERETSVCYARMDLMYRSAISLLSSPDADVVANGRADLYDGPGYYGTRWTIEGWLERDIRF
jgi:hypothetical protein